MNAKTLFAALAASSMFTVFGALQSSVNFEGTHITNWVYTGVSDDGALSGGTSYYSFNGEREEDECFIINHEGTPTLPTNANSDPVDKSFGQQYLKLDTGSGTLFRYINAVDEENYVITDNGIFIDTLVQFTVTEDDAPDLQTDDKLAIWLGVTNVNNAVTTNLYVKAAFLSYENNAFVREDATYTISNVNVEPGAWVRLTVEAIKNIAKDKDTKSVPAFRIRINDTYANFAESWYDNSAEEFLDTTETYLPSRTYSTAFQGVGFKGTGAIDDLVITDVNPFYVPVSFTLNWDANITAIEAYFIEDSTDVGDVGTEIENLDATASVRSYLVSSDAKVGNAIEIEVPSADSYTATEVGYEIDWENTTLVGVSIEPLYYGEDIYAYKFVATNAGPYVVELNTKAVATPPEPTPEIDSEPVANADALIASFKAGHTMTLPEGWTFDASTGLIKDANGDTYATVKTYYTYDSSTGEIALDETKVTPTIGKTEGTGGDSDTEPIVVSADSVTLNVTNGKEGLYYGVRKYATLGGAYTDTWESTPCGADGNVTLSVDRGESEASAFYAVIVNDALPAGAGE